VVESVATVTQNDLGHTYAETALTAFCFQLDFDSTTLRKSCLTTELPFRRFCTTRQTPFTEPSELHKIIAEVLPNATDPIKCWLMTEEHGYWNEATNSFENRASTLKPKGSIHCVSLDEAFKAIEAQVMLRVRSGFKYQFEWDPMSPTHFRKFEIQPDGAKKEY